MKRVIYKIDSGELDFRIGGDYVLSSIDTDDGDADVQTESYIGSDGEDVQEVLYNARSVEIKGYIRAQNAMHLQLLREKLVRLCDMKKNGTLTVVSGGRQYIANARPESLPTFGDVKQYMQNFVCMFSIPKFWWKKKNPGGNVMNAFSRSDLITSETVFEEGGNILTRRIGGGTIVNRGDTAGDVIITIVCNIAAPSADSVIKIIHTLPDGSETEMTINHDMSTGETVVIDTERSTIKSYIDGDEVNILHKLDGDFVKLPVGENTFTVLNSLGGDIAVKIEYYDRFAGVGIC